MSRNRPVYDGEAGRRRRAPGAAVLVVAAMLAAAACGSEAPPELGREPSGHAPVAAEPGGAAGACTVTVRTPSGAILQVEVAADPAARARGLSGRERLEPGTAMALAFPEPTYVTIWMKNMRFAIDAVWIDGDQVVGIEPHLPAPAPGTPDEDLPVYTGRAPADVVLELEAGTAAALGLEPGARVVWDPDSPAACAQASAGRGSPKSTTRPGSGKPG